MTGKKRITNPYRVPALGSPLFSITREPRHRVHVLANEKVAPKLLRVELERPRDFTFHAGQYLWLVLPERSKAFGMIDRRAYSIASGSKAKSLEFIIRQTYSDYLKAVARLQTGQAVEIIGPFGSSFIPSRSGALMIAGGSGISPFFSILRSSLPGTFSLFAFEARRRSLAKVLNGVKLGTKGRSLTTVVGRPTAARLAAATDKREQRPIFISGPQGFVTAVSDILLARGVSRDRMRFEAFFPASDGDHDIERIFSSLDESGSVVTKSLIPTQKRVFRNLSRLVQKRKLAATLDELNTALRLSEMFIRISEQASNHVVVTNHAGHVLYANQSAERMTGYSFKEMRGQSPRLWGGLMPPTNYRDLWERKTGGQIITHQLMNRRKNGQLYTALGRVTPIIMRGRVVAYISTEEDISHLTAVDKAKTEFVSLASHQLRAPLTAISWYTEMLLAGHAGKVSPRQKQYLEEIHHGNRRMIELVDALLNVSRLDLGTFTLEAMPTNVAEISGMAVKEMRKTINEKHLRVGEHYAKHLSKKITIDPRLTRIILQNLISNAVKYTPPRGRVDITIAFKKKSRAQHGNGLSADSLIITVADTGYGIPKQQQKDIFTKLFRADNVREKDTEGTGLGLYIVKSVVERFRGRVWFESQENAGTAFHVIIPLQATYPKKGLGL